MHRPGRDPHLTLTSDLRELVVLDKECGVLDGRAPVARNEPRPFEHSHRRRLRLAFRLTGAAGHGEQTGRDEQAGGQPRHEAHGRAPFIFSD